MWLCSLACLCVSCLNRRPFGFEPVGAPCSHLCDAENKSPCVALIGPALCLELSLHQTTATSALVAEQPTV